MRWWGKGNWDEVKIRVLAFALSVYVEIVVEFALG